jgi:hypothetical protein
MAEQSKPKFLAPLKDDIDDLDYWRLCDELSIKDAALLIAGKSPSGYFSVEHFSATEKPKGYEAARTALLNALRSGKIKGTIEPEVDSDINGNEFKIAGTVSIASRVEVEALKGWLVSRGVRPSFFFPDATDTPDYLDQNHPRYAPKLAAAVAAWQAVAEPGGKHPKQALVKWLRENAKDFKLTDDDGKPNETGIEEAAKVANWQPSGGAPKTPSGIEPPQD